MKNEFQQHKKSDSIKWGVAFTLIAILTITTVLGFLQAFTDVKPSEWFSSDVNQVTPGDDQSSDEVPTCEHVFELGKCTKCGNLITNVIPTATKIVKPGEAVVVNFYTPDYKLIESKTVKSGESIELIEGYSDYSYITTNTYTIPEADETQNGYYLVNDSLFSVEGYDRNALYKYNFRYQNDEYMQDCYFYEYVPYLQMGIVMINGLENIVTDPTDNLAAQSFGLMVSLPSGTEFSFVYVTDGMNELFAKDGFMLYQYTDQLACFDVQNIIVNDYYNSEVA